MGQEFIKRRLKLVSEYDDMFKKFVAALVEKVPGSTVILIGSRAKGDARPSSDFDIVLVTTTPPGWGLLASLYQLAGELPVDIIPASPADLQTPLFRQMLKGCKTLHDGLGISPCP